VNQEKGGKLREEDPNGIQDESYAGIENRLSEVIRVAAEAVGTRHDQLTRWPKRRDGSSRPPKVKHYPRAQRESQHNEGTASGVTDSDVREKRSRLEVLDAKTKAESGEEESRRRDDPWRLEFEKAGTVGQLADGPSAWRLTVKLRDRREAPDWSRRCKLCSSTLADTTDSHGPLQRLLGGTQAPRYTKSAT
jgi:hypothetical protein